MRKLLVALLLSAVVALGAQVALAAPNVSGYIEQKVTYAFGADSPYTFGQTLFRVNVSGDASDSLSYFGRIQATAGKATTLVDEDHPLASPVVYGYLTYKNLGTAGLNVSVGRQLLYWSRVNNYDGESAFAVGAADAVLASYSLGGATVNGYYKVNKPGTKQKLASDEQVGGRVTFKPSAGGLALDLAAVVQVNLTSGGGSGYGVSGSVGLGALGSVYAEVGKKPGATDNDIVVGANIDVLKGAGVSAWFEYNVDDQNYAFALSRDLVKGLNLSFSGNNDSGKLAFSATLKASTSF